MPCGHSPTARRGHRVSELSSSTTSSKVSSAVIPLTAAVSFSITTVLGVLVVESLPAFGVDVFLQMEQIKQIPGLSSPSSS